MKKILLSILLLLSVTIISYSQDAINITTRYLYDYSDKRAYVHKVLFAFEGKILKIYEEENRTNISGKYRIINHKKVYDNQFGDMLKFLVEEISTSSNTLPKQYVLTRCTNCIYFMPRTDAYNPERYVYLDDKPDE
jgi:hypothetical protein